MVAVTVETMPEDKVKWQKARKKPVTIRFREVRGKTETIKTREGVLTANVDEDFIIKGVKGELYPIKKAIFYETYDVIE